MNEEEKPKRPSLRTELENEIIIRARAYGRMKLWGMKVEENEMRLVDRETKEQLVDHFGKLLMYSAEQLIMGMAIDELDGKLKP